MRIELDRVSKQYKDFYALDDIGFAVESGELVVILGPSGCGKSTLLRIIAGLEEVSSGRVNIGGRDVTFLPSAERGISMVFQSYALFPHLNVAENIVFGLRIQGRSKEDIAKRLQRAAGMLGLEQLLDRKPAQLSGGQRQRVALGRAIVSQKPICLMDEPLSNLDAKLRHEMRAEIRSLQQRLGITMVYVTHDQTEAMSMADHIILLRDGRIEQSGAPEQIYMRPATTFTARFIGTPPMNLIRLEDRKDGAVIEGTDGPAVLKCRADGLLLGVRPEHITLVGNGGVPARITDVEYHGAESILTCQTGGQLFALRMQGRTPLACGAKVSLTWSASDVHLFEAGSGNRREPAGLPNCVILSEGQQQRVALARAVAQRASVILADEAVSS